MKTIALILTGAAFLAAATEPGQTPAKPKTVAEQRAEAAAARARQAKIAPAATPAGAEKGIQPVIPADAVEVGPNLYRRQDAQGKTSFYSRTPFGISKWQDAPSAATPAPPAAVKQDAPLIATDLGDRVQFERKSPFGSTKWIRKKSELTDEEKAAVAAAPPAQSRNKVAEKQ